MKNLKKALVLVLAFAMIFSMFTINASAASFTDDDAIVNTDAVNTMSQLGVINGYEDGSFLPTQVVTRAEMCKMICVALNGGTAPIIDGTTVFFSDTKGHWANSYIAYCYNLGIVSGDSGKGGVFRPDATVTGTEAAKMMLVALGYKPAISGFTGAEWANNVSMEANNKNLFDNLGAINAAAGLTRDNAAQLIYNGINAKMVEYKNILSTGPDGQLTSTPEMSDLGYTILSKKFNVQKVIGVLVANETYGLSGAATKDNSTIFVRSIDGTALATPATTNYKVKAPSALIGQEVALYIKTVGSTTTVLGNVFATTNNKVITTNAGLSTGAVTVPGSYLKYVKDNSIKFETTATAATEYKADATAFYINNTLNATAFTNNGNGVELVFIDNDNDGKVEVVTQTTSTLTKVIAYSTTDENLTLSTAGVIDFKNCIGYENVAKNDYVNYTLKNGKYAVTKAETVTGKVTAYTDTKNFTVGGTVYKPSASALQTTLTSVTTAANSISALGFTDTYTFYLDVCGNPVAYKVAEAGTESSTYAAVLNSGVKKSVDPLTGENTYTGTVKLLLADGTVSTYTIDMLASAKKFAGEANTYLSYDSATGLYLTTNVAGSAGATDTDLTAGLTVCAAGDNTNALKILSFAKYIANQGNAADLTAATVYNELAGQIITYSIEDGKIILAPTADTRDGTGTVYKNQTTLGAGVMNSSTTFLYYDSASKKGTAVTGIANLASTTNAKDTVATYLIDSKTNLVKYVFINAAPKSSSSYAYVKSDVSVISEGGKTYNSYDVITTAGDKITVKIEDGSTVVNTTTDVLVKDTVYSYEINSSNVVTKATVSTYDPTSQTTSNPLLAANSYFSGYVSAVNGEVVTLTSAEGWKFSFTTDSLNVWNVTGATPVAGEISEGNQVTIVTSGPTVKVAAAYITKTSAATYALSFNGTVVGYYNQGASITLTTSTATADLLIDHNTAAARDAQSDANKEYKVIMGNAAMSVSEAYTLTLTNCTAKANGDSVTSGQLVAVGSTVVVTANVVNTALTVTGPAAAAVTTVTAPAAADKAVYSFVMPTTNSTVSD